MVRYIAVVTVALVCLATAVGGAWAQAAGAFKIGVVDIDEVGAKFDRKKQEETKLAAWYDQQQQLLHDLSLLPFLSADEWKEAVAIYQAAKASWTQAQIDREKALRDLCTQREKEFNDLKAKPGARTAEDQGRINVLQDLYQARDAQLKELAASLDDELRDRQGKLGAALMEPVQLVIKQIAAEKGYTLILTKAVVFLGGDDLTAEVIEKVNAAAKAAEKPAGGEAPKPAGGAGEKPATGEGGKK